MPVNYLLTNYPLYHVKKRYNWRRSLEYHFDIPLIRTDRCINDSNSRYRGAHLQFVIKPE